MLAVALACAGALLLVDRAVAWQAADHRGLLIRLGDETRAGEAAFALLALALAAFGIAAFRHYLVDDCFITFRYARNALATGSVTWNPGEPPVEGYSNFLWMLLAMAALALHLEPLAVARVVAALAVLAAAGFSRTLARRAGAGPLGARLAALTLLATPALWMWAMSGLETAAVVAFALAWLVALDRDLGARGLPWRSALAATLLILSRPEAPVFVALPLGLSLAARDRAERRRAWGLALAIAVLVAPYFGWRAWHFGTLVPNTVAAKWRAFAGMRLVTDALAFAAPLAALAAPGLVRGGTRPERHAWLLLAGTALVVIDAQPQVGHELRFFLPALAGAIAVSGAALERLVMRPDGRVRGGALAGLACAVLLWLWAPLPAMRDYAERERSGLAAAHVRIGRLLGERFGPGAVLAASDCGALPWYSRMRTVDLWGLTDRRIAQRGFDAAYVMSSHPDVVVLNSLGGRAFNGRAPYDRGMFEALARTPALRLQGRWEFGFYQVWVWSDRPLAAAAAGADTSATP